MKNVLNFTDSFIKKANIGEGLLSLKPTTSRGMLYKVNALKTVKESAITPQLVVGFIHEADQNHNQDTGIMSFVQPLRTIVSESQFAVALAFLHKNLMEKDGAIEKSVVKGIEECINEGEDAIGASIIGGALSTYKSYFNDLRIIESTVVNENIQNHKKIETSDVSIYSPVSYVQTVGENQIVRVGNEVFSISESCILPTQAPDSRFVQLSEVAKNVEIKDGYAIAETALGTIFVDGESMGRLNKVVCEAKLGKKSYSEQFNVGKAKYVINYHDGIKTHKDGSPFSDIFISKNKKDHANKIKSLKNDGYVLEGVGEKTIVDKTELVREFASAVSSYKVNESEMIKLDNLIAISSDHENFKLLENFKVIKNNLTKEVAMIAENNGVVIATILESTRTFKQFHTLKTITEAVAFVKNTIGVDASLVFESEMEDESETKKKKDDAVAEMDKELEELESKKEEIGEAISRVEEGSDAYERYIKLDMLISEKMVEVAKEKKKVVDGFSVEEGKMEDNDFYKQLQAYDVGTVIKGGSIKKYNMSERTFKKVDKENWEEVGKGTKYNTSKMYVRFGDTKIEVVNESFKKPKPEFNIGDIVDYDEASPNGEKYKVLSYKQAPQANKDNFYYDFEIARVDKPKWTRKAYANNLKLVKSVNESENKEDSKIRFDIDFYKKDSDRKTSKEEIFRASSLSEVVKYVQKYAKDYSRIEINYKDYFVGSVKYKWFGKEFRAEGGYKDFKKETPNFKFDVKVNESEQKSGDVKNYQKFRVEEGLKTVDIEYNHKTDVLTFSDGEKSNFSDDGGKFTYKGKEFDPKLNDEDADEVKKKVISILNKEFKGKVKFTWGYVLESEQKSGDDKAYQKFLADKLKGMGKDSLNDLSDEETKKFFDEVEKEWKADDEANESGSDEVEKDSDKEEDIDPKEKRTDETFVEYTNRINGILESDEDEDGDDEDKEDTNESYKEGVVVSYKSAKDEDGDKFTPTIKYRESSKDFSANFGTHTEYSKKLKDLKDEMDGAGFKVDEIVQESKDYMKADKAFMDYKKSLEKKYGKSFKNKDLKDDDFEKLNDLKQERIKNKAKVSDLVSNARVGKKSKINEAFNTLTK